MAIQIPLSKTGKHRDKFIAVVSDEDAVLAQFSWVVWHKKDKSAYAQRVIHENGKAKLIAMHRIIAERMFGEIPAGMIVDHIDGDGLNNTRANIRLATRSQNGANSRKNKNKSLPKGVTMSDGKYRARIIFQGKSLYLGVFDTKELAKAAYDTKAQELFGNYWNSGDTN